VKDVFKYSTDAIFVTLLLELNILYLDVTVALQELEVTFLDVETIITSLQSLSKGNEEKFIALYAEALSLSLIDVLDYRMLCKLKELTSDFSEESTIKILRISCESVDTFKGMGKFLRDFCNGLETEKASSYILKGID